MSNNKQLSVDQYLKSHWLVFPDTYEIPSHWHSLASKRLTSLEGCPEFVGCNFNLANNYLSSFKGAPKFILGYLNVTMNSFTDFKGINEHIKRIDGWLYADENMIDSHVLGLMRIKGLTGVRLSEYLRPVQDILNHHIQHAKSIYDCQDALIEANMERFAQL